MTSSLSVRMCRCCASKGTFKDIHTKYQWMGDEEVYADMLKDCLDINLSVPEDSENGGICEVCITQLRNASNFKKQVLNTEELFKIHLQSKTFRSQVKCEELELPDSIESEDDNLHDSTFEAPQEYEVLIKEETEDIKPKKQQSAKASTSRKKAKVEGSDAPSKSNRQETGKVVTILKPAVSKGLIHKRAPIAVIKKETNDWSVTIKSKNKLYLKSKESVVNICQKKEIDKHLQNIKMILLHSNATPIRCRAGIGYVCCFCVEEFVNAADLKEHTMEMHDNMAKSRFMNGYPLSSYIVKLDITSLNCNICNNDIYDLDQLIEHLKNKHDKELYTDIKNHILPFKFDTDALRCVVCSNTFEHFKYLQEHMSIHYQNYMCDVCDAPFVNKRTLQSHKSRHKQGEFACNFCQKVFGTRLKKSNHERFVHTGDAKRNKCPYCSEKFSNYSKKIDHMVKQHGAQPLILKCNACDKSFNTRLGLTRHTRRDHLLERSHACDRCDMKFYAKKELTHHMIKHTGVRQHRCHVCLKAYGRKNTLREHLRIHVDDRRFKCECCGQAFVQKCSWKSHMRSKHGQLVH